MPVELPFCRGEYWWSQSEPIQASVIAVLHLPHRCSIAVSFGEDLRRQSLTLSLVQSPTGLGHLVLTDVKHNGCADEPTVTEDLYRLLMNTTIILLRHHCDRQVTLGGQVPAALLSDSLRIALTWERWGFQLLSAPAPDRLRLLARVGTLKRFKLPSSTGYFPTKLAREALQWSAA
jgi:hypothetical protein